MINEVIYSEVSVRYSRIEDLDLALAEALFEREDLPYEAAFLAGKVFRTYRRSGGMRRSSLPDFLTGAHTAIAGYQLPTRDVARYRTYFAHVRLIASDCVQSALGVALGQDRLRRHGGHIATPVCPPRVLAGFRPATHDFRRVFQQESWMAGTRPAKTRCRPAIHVFGTVGSVALLRYILLDIASPPLTRAFPQ